MIGFKIDKVEVDAVKVANSIVNDKMGLFAATEWHRLYKDYVPMETGALYNNVSIEPWEITHTVPYAHYAYEGKVFSPSIPITEGAYTAGYFSPPGKPKKKTGRTLKFSKAQHPKATAKWDKAAEAVQLTKLVRALQEFVDKKV